MTDPEDEMVQGYRDGNDPESPEPSQNRSRSYRHGFMTGRADLARKPAGRPDALREAAEQAIREDLAR